MPRHTHPKRVRSTRDRDRSHLNTASAGNVLRALLDLRATDPTHPRYSKEPHA